MSNTENTADPPVGDLNQNPPNNSGDANAGQAAQTSQFNELREENARLNNRLDTVVSMLNTLMMHQAQQASVPNIPGWPPAHGPTAPTLPPQGIRGTTAQVIQATASAPPPALQTIAIQSPNHYSTHVPLPAAGPTPQPGGMAASGNAGQLPYAAASGGATSSSAAHLSATGATFNLAACTLSDTRHPAQPAGLPCTGSTASSHSCPACS